MFARALSLAATLFGLWLLLSGHYTPLLLSFGVLSVVVVVWIAWRMDVVDHEGHPIHLSLKAVSYWPWLLKEIVKANLDVVRRVLSPRLPISPTIASVSASQATEVGRVTFANSITLTPGTVSLEVWEDHVEVHALSREGMEDLQGGEMDRRAKAMEGRT